MDNPIESAISDSLPDPTEVAAPSAADANASSSEATPAAAPAQKAGQEKEPPFHEHPRWKEMQEERKQLMQQNQKLMDLMQQQRQVPTSEPVKSDPLSKFPESERGAWQEIYNLAKMAAAEELAAKGQPFIQDLEQQKQIVAAMAYQSFQARHPDIKPGSNEENAIAEKIRAGYHPEDAYKLVTFDKKYSDLEAQMRTKEAAKTQQKIAANLETKNVSSQSPISQKPKTFRETAAEAVEQFFAPKS